MSTVYLVKELELPDCNFSHVYGIFANKRSAERLLEDLQHPRIGYDRHPERFTLEEWEVLN